MNAHSAGVVEKQISYHLNKDEVSGFQFSRIEDLVRTISSAGEKFRPWFLQAFEKFLGGVY